MLLSSISETDSTMRTREEIEQRLEKSIVDQRAFVKRFVSRAPNWSKEPEKENGVKFPTFVYSNGALVYWNDHKFTPVIEAINKDQEIGTLRLYGSQFIYLYKDVSVNNDHYDVVSLVPLLRSYGISNKYLKSTPNNDIFPKGISPLPLNGYAGEVISYNGLGLFKISSSSVLSHSAMKQMVLGVLIALFIVFTWIVMYRWSQYVIIKRSWWKGVLLLAFGLIGWRAFMLGMDFPRQLVDFEIFDSKIYISSAFNPSLGDLFINIVCLLLLSAVLFKVRDELETWVNQKLSTFGRTISHILIFGITLWLLSFNYRLVFDILSNSQIDLDISKSLDFPLLRTIAFVTTLASGLCYFLLVHTAYRILVLGVSRQSQILTVLVGVAGFVFFEIMYHSMIWWILVVQLIYFAVVYINRLPMTLLQPRFGSAIYLVLTSVVLSVTWSGAIYKAFEDDEIIRKDKFETKLLLDRDLDSEFLLNEVLSRIQSDVIINARIINPQSSLELIKERIKRTFLSGYFNQYHVYIRLFDKNGKPLGQDGLDESVEDVKGGIRSSLLETDFTNIYYQKDISSATRRRYVCLIDLERYGNPTGFAVLDFQLKKQIAKSVYPELLLDNKGLEKREFDYAVYINNALVYNSGSFNYPADFDKSWMNEKDLYADGLERNGFHHLAHAINNQVIVITSKVYPTWSLASNFSFFFLLFSILCIGVVGLQYVTNHGTRHQISFSTKILFYMGASFAIPLVLVGAAILNTINQSYKKEIDKSHEKETLALSEVLVELIDSFESDDINRGKLAVELSRVAINARTDLSVYDTDGILISSSQPTIFTAGLLSNLVNPEALRRIKRNSRNKVILDESIGALVYKTSYVAIRSFQDGRLLGILASPYFGSKNHLNRQSTEVFNNIINISTIILLISIGLSYLAVRRLTNPIILIAARLKKLALEGQNQPLEWASNDEIGTLVKEYNSMLTKLDQSKKELARNEKEAAWREMAKQVAHEIKNPLTPMKLTLQHWDRRLEKDDPSRKTVNTLLVQVDTLDEIVTSFSHFAKMPDPEKVDFDIKMILENIVSLHPDRNIDVEVDSGDYRVLGDEKLFGRIFNNIILNAFQAMSGQTDPHMNVTLSTHETTLTLAFRDTGPGIPDEIQDKVFVPNFSTKDSGSGIGLAVAKRGIEHAGGRIWFSSQQNKGTTFYIELPRAHK